MKTIALLGLMTVSNLWAGSFNCLTQDFFPDYYSLSVETLEEDQVTAALYGFHDDFAHTTTLLNEFSGQKTGNLKNSSKALRLYSKTTYDLLDTQGVEALLTMINSPLIGRGGWGRAGCTRANCSSSGLTANLKYLDKNLNFDCYEQF